MRRVVPLVTRSTRLNLISFVAGIGLLSLGCDLGPDRPTPTGPVVKYTVSGTVSEVGPTGLAPLSGAEVREEWSRVHAVTDSNGFYMLSGVYGATASVKVTRNGYVPATKTLAAEVDAQLNFEVNRIVTYVLSGVAFEMVTRQTRTAGGGRGVLRGMRVPGWPHLHLHGR